MKKQAILKSILMLLPVLAVGLATTADSVMIFDSLTGTTTYYSYFDLLPVASLQLVTPLAGILSGLAGILAAIYLATKKVWSIKALTWVSFAAAVVAVLPILNQGEAKVIPNVGLPIFMLIEYAYAYVLGKKSDLLTAQKEAPRLKRK